MGLPGGSVVENLPATQETWLWSLGQEDPWVRKIPWRRTWQPTPVLLPGESHGWRSLVGCSPWGHKELDTTERPHFHFSLSCIGEGNGNPLQCSCLENPVNKGAWREQSIVSQRVGHNWSNWACLFSRVMLFFPYQLNTSYLVLLNNLQCMGSCLIPISFADSPGTV